MKDYKSAFEKAKIAACSLLVRTSLNNGNENVKNAIRDTKHNKDKTFDKITAMMLDTCMGLIEKNDINTIITSDNANHWSKEYEKYVTFNKNVFQIIGPELQNTPSEKKIIEQIQSISNSPAIETPSPQVVEVEDYLTEKLGIYKYTFFGSIIGVMLFLVFLLLNKLINQS